MPEVSVILNTARSGHTMVGFPDIHHFKYTIGALRRQSFSDFELVISDYLYDKRSFDWDSIGDLRFQIFHVPVVHSIAKNMGYAAISATKNAGAMFASGRFLIFLDDCCSFPSEFVQRMYETWMGTGSFPNALHIKELGSTNYRDANGELIRDCRYKILEDRKVKVLVDAFNLYGYSSCSMEAMLRLNGFAEIFDFSRQLEDIHFGERLKAAGYHISLHKNLFVAEQEHYQIAPDPGGTSTPKHFPEDPHEFKENLKCNGPFYQMMVERRGDDMIKSNHRAMTIQELGKINPCYMLNGSGCKMSGLPCNWLNPDGTTRHLKHPDAKEFFDNQPIFSLEQMRQESLTRKEGYRVK